jgi:hypothetical protein
MLSLQEKLDVAAERFLRAHDGLFNAHDDVFQATGVSHLTPVPILEATSTDDLTDPAPLIRSLRTEKHLLQITQTHLVLRRNQLNTTLHEKESEITALQAALDAALQGNAEVNAPVPTVQVNVPVPPVMAGGNGLISLQTLVRALKFTVPYVGTLGAGVCLGRCSRVQEKKTCLLDLQTNMRGDNLAVSRKCTAALESPPPILTMPPAVF